jgi:hypothetical protein
VPNLLTKQAKAVQEQLKADVFAATEQKKQADDASTTKDSTSHTPSAGPEEQQQQKKQSAAAADGDRAKIQSELATAVARQKKQRSSASRMGVDTTPYFAPPFNKKGVILPRQARDKHRKS